MHSPSIPHAPPTVAIVACHGQGLFEFGCAVGLFAPVRPELDVAWYTTQLCAGEPGALRMLGSALVQLPHGLEAVDQADIVVIPGWRDPAERPPEVLLDAVVRAHRRGARIASICSGAFVLAWAGLLDGRNATTHWRLTETLARQFPAVTVREDVLYVDEGSVITSAGSATGMDMMLHMVRGDYGVHVANLVAERLVLAPWRDAERSQRVTRAIPVGEPTRLARLMEWVRGNLHEDHSLRSLSEQAALSQRTLQRQFLETTGLSPIDWLIRERVAFARELLETTDRPLNWVAEHAGFGSQESFRRHFRSQTQVSPTGYRNLHREGIASQALLPEPLPPSIG
ncbi:helix-turn-helix domain-containing protein [Pseudoxanthomonas sp.]|uniref:helix-turn-helix domain-containing protein n=1 Tax=Pseudoxanthomonas sp. TaxID=1871049 RepID=UPI0026276AA3|nr:helix-turn-helix domain-containing protein [Pseudoxanthomonas sp.]WDS36625.1 MAG: helix-turn-helix domain-containing protein [Pseudoxanthomonas sp.]